jgi:hypothetical protein
MARTRRKPSRSRKLGDAEARKSSEVCRDWVERYGQDFRTAQSCGKQLARLKGARGGAAHSYSEYGQTVATCTHYLNDIVKRGATDGISVVASCVRRGYGHGVQQASWPTRKRATAAATSASEQRRWAHERDRKY